ncbi:flagellin-like hook-associated protein FlgL [Agromyces flavus]|uniref:Flagellin-like hook-associated protein FlgL n=1 Tax=Agromyces flavus TaxID=589382 RepID=A0A1H1P9L7_9MICO|nr:hypothetical protein [Agromyces flavus]MCP2367975.1 flagellin-like hook-associated protein FlgL [Agromyces flavus]GGI47437.1 hypothetical protein GCM10010932_21250 [Agromyces flavus]SDS07329.1 hypothetical protein SAMN04489721_0727 [Agromyces flavus]
MATTDALTEAADALYALVPEEFTAARNARAAEAKPGDPALAKRIAALKRPSPSAWIVNRLAREHADRVADLAGLGGELADAQASGDGRAMTALVAERREIVGDLLRAAVEVADAADRSPSRAVLDEVERTLVAATVSEDAGVVVRTGRLVRALQAVGSDVDLDGAVAGEASAAPPRARPKRAGAPTTGEPGVEKNAAKGTAKGDEEAEADAAAERRAARDRAEAALREAREHADETRGTLDAATERLEAATRRLESLREERDELERRLDELRDELGDADREARTARREHESATDANDRAEVGVEDAEDELAELD